MLVSYPVQSIRRYTFSYWVDELVKVNLSICSVDPSNNVVKLHIINHQKGIVHFVNLEGEEVLLSSFVLLGLVSSRISLRVLKGARVVAHFLVGSVDEKV